MAHVVQHPSPPRLAPLGRLEVHQVPAATDNLIWLLVDPQSREACAIDGPEAGAVLDYCSTHGLRLTTIANTHIHHDHIGINHDLAKRGLLAKMRVIGARKTAQSIPGLTDPVEDGDRIQLLGAEAAVWLTEGHINGHISYIVNGVLLCGDTLFAGGCGYLFDGPPTRMHESLQRLATLPDETLVCCAHEYTQDNLRFAYSVDSDNQALSERIRDVWALRAAGGCTLPSSIGLERSTNPFLRVGSAGIRSRLAEVMPDHDLSEPAAVFAALRALKDRKDYRTIDDGELPI